MNKNKNIKSSQKEENVKVRRVRQLDETNTNKNNKKEKPSVISRSVRMRDVRSMIGNRSSFYQSVIDAISKGTGFYNLSKKLDLSYYPDYFSVTSYNDHVYAIKIIKEFVYEEPITLSYKEILAFQSYSDTENTTLFDSLDGFKKSRNKYMNDIANNTPWSVWYGASEESPERYTLNFNGIPNDLFDEKVSKPDGSSFVWQGKIVVKIDTMWNITLSFRTEDGWLPDNKQSIYGNLSMKRRELNSTNKNLQRFASYAPPDIDGLADEPVYTDEYNDTLHIIRRTPRVHEYVYKTGSTMYATIDTSNPYYQWWYDRGLPYYYGPVTVQSGGNSYNYCTSSYGTGTNQHCLQGMGRYVYISAKSEYNIGDGIIYVSKSGAGKSIVDFNAHIVGYYYGARKVDQDIKVNISFNYLPKEIDLLVPNIVFCDPSNYNDPSSSPSEYYKFYYPPKELQLGVKRYLEIKRTTFFPGIINTFEFAAILNKLITDDVNPGTSLFDLIDQTSAIYNIFRPMYIITNSNGPISFELTEVIDTSKRPLLSPVTVTLTNSDFTIKASILLVERLNEDDISGKFTLKITQDATMTYAKKVTNITFKWSIEVVDDQYRISFTRI